MKKLFESRRQQQNRCRTGNNRNPTNKNVRRSGNLCVADGSTTQLRGVCVCVSVSELCTQLHTHTHTHTRTSAHWHVIEPPPPPPPPPPSHLAPITIGLMKEFENCHSLTEFASGEEEEAEEGGEATLLVPIKLQRQVTGRIDAKCFNRSPPAFQVTTADYQLACLFLCSFFFPTQPALFP